MLIERKILLKVSLLLLVIATSITSIIIVNNIVIIHGEWDDLLTTNRILIAVGMPLTIFYLYLLFMMRKIAIFKYLFIIGVILNIFTISYGVFQYDPIIYLRYGRDWDNAMYFYMISYIMAYTLLAFFSFLTNESLATKLYLAYSLIAFSIFTWFPYTMFGANLTVNMYFEMSGNEMTYYVIGSIINAIFFMFIIESSNKKIIEMKTYNESEKEDFSSFLKARK